MILILFPSDMGHEKRNQLLELLQPLGSTPVVDESKIEAYAVSSAMGHTYFFFHLQKRKELSLKYGLEEREAQMAITEMLRGTTEPLVNSGLADPEVGELVPVKPMGEVEEV